MFDRNVLVLQLFGFVLGGGEHLGEAGADGLRVHPADLGQLLDFALKADGQPFYAHPGLVQHGRGQPLLLIQQGQEQVIGVNLLVVHAGGELLRAGDRFAGLLGQLFGVHLAFS